MHLPIHSPLDVAVLKSALLAHHAALASAVHTFGRLEQPIPHAQARAEEQSALRMLLIVCEIERDGATGEAPISALPMIAKGTRVKMNREVGRIPKGMFGTVTQDGHYQAVYVDFGLRIPVQIVRDAFDILPPSGDKLDMESFELIQTKDGLWRHVSHKLGLASQGWMAKAAAQAAQDGYDTTPAAMSEMAHRYITLFPITSA